MCHSTGVPGGVDLMHPYDWLDHISILIDNVMLRLRSGVIVQTLSLRKCPTVSTMPSRPWCIDSLVPHVYISLGCQLEEDGVKKRGEEVDIRRKDEGGQQTGSKH